MEKGFDYNEYDGLSLALKENESERILTYYEAFGWEVYEKRDDGRYFDIIHIKLKRPHKIPNKDRLQFLQVKMEAVVNRFALVRKNRHACSVISGLSFSIFAVGFVSLGAWLLISQFVLPLAISSLIIGLASPFAIIPLVKATVKREKERFALKFKEMTAEISRIISRAEKLSGGENGEI